MTEQQTNVPFTIDPSDIKDESGEIKLSDPVNEGETKPSATETDKVFRKVKFNKADVDVFEKDVDTLLQKGLNHDHIKGELDTFKNLGLSKADAEELKALAGDTPIKDFVKNLKEKEFNDKLNARASELKAEGLSDEHAMRMAKLELSQTQKQPEKSPEQVLLEKGFAEMYKLFPETQNFTDLSQLPTKVVDMIREGITPSTAYSKYKLEEQARQAEIDKKNLLNQVQNEGSLSTEDAGADNDTILNILRKA